MYWVKLLISTKYCDLKALHFFVSVVLNYATDNSRGWLTDFIFKQHKCHSFTGFLYFHRLIEIPGNTKIFEN